MEVTNIKDILFLVVHSVMIIRYMGHPNESSLCVSNGSKKQTVCL